MKLQKIYSLLLAFLITTCISPMATSSNGNTLPVNISTPTISTTTPSSPKIATITYIPLVVKNKTSTPVPPAGNGIIADHTVISFFATIPEANVKAASGIKALFLHASVGNNIQEQGLECLQGTNEDPTNPFVAECRAYPDYYYDRRNWNWPYWNPNSSGAIFKTDQFVSEVIAQYQNYQVFGMKFCYDDAFDINFDYYRQKIEQLEQTYPQKTFIWATEALLAESEINNYPDHAKNIQDFNQQLRAYARANNKILFDLADIESHDPNGNLCQTNGIEALCEVNARDGGHPNWQGSIPLAKGFWWLMARISGWNDTVLQ